MSGNWSVIQPENDWDWDLEKEKLSAKIPPPWRTLAFPPERYFLSSSYPYREKGRQRFPQYSVIASPLSSMEREGFG